MHNNSTQTFQDFKSFFKNKIILGALLIRQNYMLILKWLPLSTLPDARVSEIIDCSQLQQIIQGESMVAEL